MKRPVLTMTSGKIKKKVFVFKKVNIYNVTYSVDRELRLHMF